MSNAESTTPCRDRLVCKLHTVILGLQDRISGLEDTLVPQLSTWLEKKSNTIDDLIVEVLRSKAEITDLKHAVDFGNKIVSGCWEREGEVWHTLAKIQTKRRARNSGLFRRLTGRCRDQKPQDADRCSGDVPEGCEKQASQHQASDVSFPRTKENSATLSNKELDALLAITAQNVRILREDVEDMVTMVQECKRRASGIEEIERVEEGSWRDV
ncbi:uncharacterized protein K460DRAFT_371745 [Cucurbitaria berberidis CBS 394.84]|uniref:Uncharacterized protein n=1 Tax=Cucurbitaria berberidis CBS 394.84 TaxID=1168544 RepID=A0A9P4L355_9PLEO|nr:uncharacterized protein K460DRAFT_371745 [Cucurbitaria berberidis CBS 394.84]KAF1840546.1 hypothetical protein K460DRAFT_371745 [Cucurbitaria berberidis CBS 394.84]